MAGQGEYYKGPQNIKLDGGKFISIKGGVKGHLSDIALGVLESAMEESNNPKIIISSIQRSPYEQASVMYRNLESQGTAAQYLLYSNHGDLIIDVYVAGKAQGKTSSNIIADMTKKIIDTRWNFGHGGFDPESRQAIDVSYRGLRNKSLLESTLTSYEQSGDIRVLKVEADHFHIEVNIKNDDGSPVVPKKKPSGASTINKIENVKINKWTNSGQYNGKFISNLTKDIEDSPIYGSDSSKILDFEYEGISNRRRIWANLPVSEKKRFNANNQEFNATKDYPLSDGVTLYFSTKDVYVIPKGANKSKVVGRVSDSPIKEYSSNITTINSKPAKLYPKVLKYISLDPGYVPAFKNKGMVSKSMFPRLKVYAWSRLMYLNGGSGYMDITSSVQDVSINSTMQGCEISITLASMVGNLNDSDSGNGWKNDDVVLIDDNVISLGNINRISEFVDPRTPNKEDVNFEYIRNNQFYEKVLQQNDMLFVKFEQLAMDSDDDLNISEKIGKGWYDTIGLIDSVDVSSNPTNSSVSINVIGRDLTKTFIEDISQINPISVGHIESMYGGKFGSNGRILASEGFIDVESFDAINIKKMLEFLIHRIASIGYVPDDIFDMFSGKTEITKSVKQKKGDTLLNTIEVKPAKGVWQLVKFWIDDNVADLNLLDSTVSNPQGSIWELMNKICQDPFIEMFTETLGTHFYVIVRRPPFEGKVLSRIVNDIQQSANSGGLFSATQGDYVGGLAAQSTNSYAKYLECLESKKKAKSSSNAYESDRIDKEIRSGNKVDVKVEDQQRVLNGSIELTQNDDEIDCTEQLRGSSDSIYPMIVNINEDDIIRDTLRHTQMAYSWYEIEDRGSFIGQNIEMGHVPAAYFDEYAQVFGNRKLQVTSNYSDFRFFQDKSEDESNYSDMYAEQASQLLTFMVETNIPLPFTREGTIVINGDRRIKKGTYIYLRSTREVYYVNGVTNSMSMSSMVDRTTTLNVSRGMVIDYIDGVEHTLFTRDGREVTKNVSYFNIINIDKFRDGIYDIVAESGVDDKFDYKKNMAIDVDIMDFFLKKRQFENKQ